MRLPAPFHAEDEHIAIDFPGASALFTTRHGGFSSGPYATLNLGSFTDDDRAAVERNRELLENRLGIRFAHARQVHGSRVEVAAEPTRPGPALTEADGHATDAQGVAPMVTTADCLPVALACDGAVAMLHAGWRGLEGGVLGEGVRTLRQLGCEGTIRAAIGPGAGPCCYEVSEEIHARFGSEQAGMRHGNNLDLKGIARAQLAQGGVTEIHDCALCTICCPEFFSHRRDRGLTGRQAGIVWLN